MIYQSTVMRELMNDVIAFADCEQTMLLMGETGVGKEVVAQQIHQRNRTYSAGPFVAVNCGAIPDTLFESLFFGHHRGAFSGAQQAHKGYFEQARGGTLFLDELGELPLLQQVKLLRVLDTRQVTPLGSEQPVDIDFRLVAATNRDLRQRIQDGTFRADLFYRVAVIEIYIPNLEERGLADRLALFHAFVHEVIADGSKQSDFRCPAWVDELLATLHLPGNVRQLRNLAERVGVVVRQLGSWDRPVIERAVTVAVTTHATPTRLLSRPRMGAEKARDERLRIVDALNRHAWVRSDTAADLGVSRKTLWEKMKSHDIVDRRGSRAAAAAPAPDGATDPAPAVAVTSALPEGFTAMAGPAAPGPLSRGGPPGDLAG